jgi:hypothetical protein
MIQFIIVFTYFFSILYINIKHTWCIYNNTCARLQFSDNVIYVYDTTTLRLNYENQHILNTYLCKSMNDLYKKLLCNITEIDNSKDFQKIQNIINKLYNVNHIICFNKNKIFNVTQKINFYCSEFDKKELNILDLIINILGIILNNIHVNKVTILLIYISYLVLADEYNRLYEIKYITKLKLDEYSEQIEYISDSCSICLNEYTTQDTIRKLKVCSHIYHQNCIDEWVGKFNNDTCPICRACVN